MWYGAVSLGVEVCMYKGVCRRVCVESWVCMHGCVCVCVWICVFRGRCILACVWLCVHVWCVHACAQRREHVCELVGVHGGTCVHVIVYMYECVCMGVCPRLVCCTYVQRWIHVCVCAYVYGCTCGGVSMFGVLHACAQMGACVYRGGCAYVHMSVHVRVCSVCPCLLCCTYVHRDVWRGACVLACVHVHVSVWVLVRGRVCCPLRVLPPSCRSPRVEAELRETNGVLCAGRMSVPAASTPTAVPP